MSGGQVGGEFIMLSNQKRLPTHLFLPCEPQKELEKGGAGVDSGRFNPPTPMR